MKSKKKTLKESYEDKKERDKETKNKQSTFSHCLGVDRFYFKGI